MEDISIMVDEIMFEHKWEPAVFGGLFLDETDEFGMVRIFKVIQSKYSKKP